MSVRRKEIGHEDWHQLYNCTVKGTSQRGLKKVVTIDSSTSSTGFRIRIACNGWDLGYDQGNTTLHIILFLLFNFMISGCGQIRQELPYGK